MLRPCALLVLCLLATVATACSSPTPASTGSPRPPADRAAQGSTAAPPPDSADARAVKRRLTARARQLCEARAMAERPQSEAAWGYPALDQVGPAEHDFAFFLWERVPVVKGRPKPEKSMRPAAYHCRVRVVDAAKDPVEMVIQDLRWDPPKTEPTGKTEPTSREKPPHKSDSTP